MPLSFGEVTKTGYGYTSILKAIERLILMRTPTLPNQYEANFEGITRALWDLGTVLQGATPPGSGATPPGGGVIGSKPPNWDSATGGYTPGGAPTDGSFWFDERQGRLFIAKDGEWFQTNGGEAFVHIGPTPPDREIPGCVWMDTRQGVTFVYIDTVSAAGEPGWYQMNGGGSSGLDLLGDLKNVSDDPITSSIPATAQAGVLMRNGAARLDAADAYKVSSKLDLGAY